ncbi:MAG: YDG domain-containing protein [Clostridiales bacterium]|jgi:hypothetical protein|nr:YDG domain-containing protein [Clostridiales bacterium]
MKKTGKKLRFLTALFVCVFVVFGMSASLIGVIGGLFGEKDAAVSAIDIGESGDEELSEAAGGKGDPIAETEHTFSIVSDEDKVNNVTSKPDPNNYWATARGPVDQNNGEAWIYTNRVESSNNSSCYVIATINFGGYLLTALRNGRVTSLKITAYWSVHAWVNGGSSDYNGYIDISTTAISGSAVGDIHTNHSNGEKGANNQQFFNNNEGTISGDQLTTVATNGKFYVKVWAWSWRSGSGQAHSAAVLENVKINPVYNTPSVSFTSGNTTAGTVTAFTSIGAAASTNAAAVSAKATRQSTATAQNNYYFRNWTWGASNSATTRLLTFSDEFYTYAGNLDAVANFAAIPFSGGSTFTYNGGGQGPTVDASAEYTVTNRYVNRAGTAAYDSSTKPTGAGEYTFEATLERDGETVGTGSVDFEITQAVLTITPASAAVATKPYDGDNRTHGFGLVIQESGSGWDLLVTGIAATDSVASVLIERVSGNVNPNHNYDSKDAGVRYIRVDLELINTNYSLATTIYDLPARIDKRQITVTVNSSVNVTNTAVQKTYDGTTNAPAGFFSMTGTGDNFLGNFIVIEAKNCKYVDDTEWYGYGADTIDDVLSLASGYLYNDKDVSAAAYLMLGGKITLKDTDNYELTIDDTFNIPAKITQKTLTISTKTPTISKRYDGDADVKPAVTYADLEDYLDISGYENAEDFNVIKSFFASLSFVYTNADIASNKTAYLTLTFDSDSNYALPNIGEGVGVYKFNYAAVEILHKEVASLDAIEIIYGAAKPTTGVSARDALNAVLTGTIAWTQGSSLDAVVYPTVYGNELSYTCVVMFTPDDLLYETKALSLSLKVKRAEITALSIPSITYGQEKPTSATGTGVLVETPTVTITDWAHVGLNGITYPNADNYTGNVTFTSDDPNYNDGTLSATLVVNKAYITALSISAITYGQEKPTSGTGTGVLSQTPTVTITGYDASGLSGVQYPNANTSGYTGNVTFVSDDPNYNDGTLSATLVVDKKEITVSANSVGTLSKEYDATKTPDETAFGALGIYLDISGLFGGDVINDIFDITKWEYDYASVAVASKVILTVELNGSSGANYKIIGVSESEFTADYDASITPKALTLAEKVPEISKIYDGDNEAPASAKSVSNLETYIDIIGYAGSDSFSDIVDWFGITSFVYNSADIGTNKTATLTITFSAGANYTVSQIVFVYSYFGVKITAGEITLALKASTPSISKVYDGTRTATVAINGTNITDYLEKTAGSFAMGDGIADIITTYVYEYDSADAGLAAAGRVIILTLTGNPNYTLTVTEFRIPATIEKADITALSIPSITYGQEKPTSGTGTGVLLETPTVTITGYAALGLSGEQYPNADTYTDYVTFVSDNPNYNGGTLSATLVVNKADITALSIPSITYGQEKPTSATGTGVLVETPTVTITGWAHVGLNGITYPNADTYTDYVTFVSENPNYNDGTLSATLVVNKADITALSIPSITYGQEKPTSATGTGVLLETPTVTITGWAHVGLNGITYPNADTYTDYVTFVSDNPNYNDGALSVTLTIAQKTLELKVIADPAVTYDGNNHYDLIRYVLSYLSGDSAVTTEMPPIVLINISAYYNGVLYDGNVSENNIIKAMTYEVTYGVDISSAISNNYIVANASGTIVINKALAVFTLERDDTYLSVKSQATDLKPNGYNAVYSHSEDEAGFVRPITDKAEVNKYRKYGVTVTLLGDDAINYEAVQPGESEAYESFLLAVAANAGEAAGMLALSYILFLIIGNAIRAKKSYAVAKAASDAARAELYASEKARITGLREIDMDVVKGTNLNPEAEPTKIYKKSNIPNNDVEVNIDLVNRVKKGTTQPDLKKNADVSRPERSW